MVHAKGHSCSVPAKVDRLLLAGSRSSAEASRGRCRVAGRDRVQWSRRQSRQSNGYWENAFARPPAHELCDA